MSRQSQGAEEAAIDEVCVIDFVIVKRGGLLVAQWRFSAQATSLSGAYSAGLSRLVYGHEPTIQRSKQAVKALDELITQLLADGWEPLPRDGPWYSCRFRRSPGTKYEIQTSGGFVLKS